MGKLENDELKQAYERGLALGKATLAGNVGCTRQFGRNGLYYLDEAQRIAEALDWSAEEVLARVVAFHKERVNAVPDRARYPEMHGVRDMLLRRYRGMADAGMSPELISLVETLAFWRDYGFQRETGVSFYERAAQCRLAEAPGGAEDIRPDLKERCRVVYAPETDAGPVHAKNVDDPLAFWQPYPPETNPGPWRHSPLFFDGVGSGLHIDEIPPEIFPADARGWAVKNCTALDEATEFLVRYNHFWGSCNFLIHDDHGNSMAFEKSSRCRIALRGPGEKGINYINGMGAVDPGMAEFVDQQRQKYLDVTGQGGTRWRRATGGCARASSATWPTTSGSSRSVRRSRACRISWRNVTRTARCA